MSEAEKMTWFGSPTGSTVEIRFQGAAWGMEDIRLMRLSPLALTFIWSRWTVTSGGWEFVAVESDFHLWFTLKDWRLCVRLSDQDDENASWDEDNLRGRCRERVLSGLVGTFG